jgi:putative holliday junction resolvase
MINPAPTRGIVFCGKIGQMKCLGIDFGAKNIGVSVSDERRIFAFPKLTIKNNADAVAKIAQLAHEEGASMVVVGNTRSLSGSANSITPEAEGFVARLQELGLHVEQMWEAWSSAEAGRYAPKGKMHDDAAAAAIILQRYLEMHHTKVQ